MAFEKSTKMVLNVHMNEATRCSSSEGKAEELLIAPVQCTYFPSTYRYLAMVSGLKYLVQEEQSLFSGLDVT